MAKFLFLASLPLAEGTQLYRRGSVMRNKDIRRATSRPITLYLLHFPVSMKFIIFPHQHLKHWPFVP